MSYSTSYSTVGAADTEWCSPSNPQGTCKPKAGICKPMFSGSQAGGGIPTLEKFKAFQSQLNRFFITGVFGKVTATGFKVDGQLGPLAVSGVNQVLGTSFTSCEQVARNVETLTTKLATLAASEGRPPAAPIPPSRPAKQSDGSLKEGNPGNPGGQTEGSIFDRITSFVTSPMGMVVAAGAVGAVIYLTRKKKPAAVAAAPAGAIVTTPKVAL